MKTDKMIMWVLVIGVLLYLGNNAGLFKNLAVNQQNNQIPAGCGVGLPAQNIQFTGYDYASGTGLSGEVANVYDSGNNLIKSSLAIATNYATNYGGTYTLYTTKTGYFPVITPVTTSCTQTAPLISVKEAAVDTSTLAFINNDGLTANAVSTATQAIGSGDAKTMTMVISGAASQKYMTDPVCGNGGQFVVVANFTNYTGEIDPTATNLIGCTPTAVPSAVSGSGLAWLCNGNVYNYATARYQLTLASKAGINPGAEAVSISIYPVTGTLSSSATGTKPMSCVVQNDAGTASGTALSGTIYIS